MPRPFVPSRPALCALAVTLAATLGTTGLAQPARPALIGDHGAWTAATYMEGGQKVCYAFARPTRSDPAGRSTVMLTVTHRPGQRDAVVLSPGYPYPRNAEVALTVGSAEFAFYAVGANAAARDRAAVIRSLRAGREAVARGTSASGRGTVTDSFPLNGFSAAHDAISQACPAEGPRR
jgi:invasion protein IalB